MTKRIFEKCNGFEDAILPTRSDAGSAGYDFYALEDCEIQPKEVVVMKTGIKAQMFGNEVLMLYVRSSIGIKKNLMLANGTGVIDSSFYNNPDNEGNIACALYNYGDKPQQIKKGDRIMQGVFMEFLTTHDDKPVNAERLGGIGSSGK